MTLRQVVEKYLAVGEGYGKPVALASLGLTREETEKIFGAWDEDYHISRFLHFRNGSGKAFQINGTPQTEVSIDPEIKVVL